MSRRYRRSELHEDILSIMDETGEEDPFEAVRFKARAVVADFHHAFPEAPPFDVNAMASMRGLHLSDDDPRFSADSEIAPEADGRVVLRINRSRPLTRQRFSVCHEIGHTLFPDYKLAVRCRKGNGGTFADPNDLLETLCDVAASELMFPTPWFRDRIERMELRAASLASLADEYQASREAMARRFVELHSEPLAAVFFSWKLKPTEARSVKAKSQMQPLFPDLDLAGPVPMLRVDYRIANASFDRVCSDYIPQDKSIPNEGPIYEASMSQELRDGEQQLDFGRLFRAFEIHTLPIFTAEDAVGPKGECSVVAVLRPLN